MGRRLEFGDKILLALIGLALCLIAKYVKNAVTALRDIRDHLARPEPD